MKILKLENLKVHALIWALFIGYELLIVYSLLGFVGNFPDNFGHYLLNIAIFYFNAHVVLPNTTSFKKPLYFKIPVIILGILVVIIIFLICKYLLLDFYNFFHIKIYPPFTSNKRFITNGVFRSVYFIGFSTGYWFAISTVQNRKKIADLEHLQLKNALQQEEMEKALLTSENAYLRAQINPHFLLNTLNFLYNSVSKYSEKVADSVMTLADIMRYALTKADEDGKVKLELEIEQISNFVKLNQDRFSQRLNIDLKITGDPDGLRIIPLVLITLAENVFKYGDLLNDDYPAKIIINIEDNNLTFITQNLKKKKAAEQGHGIGISNVKNRLAMHHRYELIIEDNEKDYKSILKIEL